MPVSAEKYLCAGNGDVFSGFDMIIVEVNAVKQPSDMKEEEVYHG